jgi:phosphoribosylamine--glycine ligase
MRMLVIGSGAREHAIVWKLAQSSLVREVFVVSTALANAGISLDNDKFHPYILTKEDTIKESADFADFIDASLTIVGPEVPLANGIVDYFKKRGLPILGPTKASSQLESSKIFAKRFMRRHGIPTPVYSDFSCIHEALETVGVLDPESYVIKADGLAAGKGVVIPKTKKEASDTVRAMMSEDLFGDAGKKIILEDRLQGTEASLMVLSDGKDFIPFESARDYKRALDGDKGLNTGGMGAFSPNPAMQGRILEKTLDEIVMPTLSGMKSEGNPFVGFLYFGLMIDGDDINVIEYNVRLGDPETQPILMRLESDFASMCLKAENGTLGDFGDVQWSSDAAVGVVLASDGYPGKYKIGRLIEGLENVRGVRVFHAGTARTLIDGDIVTNGGRVLTVAGTASTRRKAREKVYRQIDKISWDGEFHRKDIARD